MGKLQPTWRAEKKDGTRTKEENKVSGDKRKRGTRNGLLAVVADHSTDELEKPVREGGEPMHKGPTVGKEKPGITFYCAELREGHRAHNSNKRKCSRVRGVA